jgi:hypothetical protein
LTFGELISDDWEIQESPVSITRTQFLKAMVAVSWSFGDEPHMRVFPSDESIEDLARRLGLEPTTVCKEPAPAASKAEMHTKVGDK